MSSCLTFYCGEEKRRAPRVIADDASELMKQAQESSLLASVCHAWGDDLQCGELKTHFCCVFVPRGEVLKVNAQIRIYGTSLSRIRSRNCRDGCFARSVLALCVRPFWIMTKQKKSKNETGLWKNRSVSFLCTIFLQMPLRGVLSKTKRCAKPPVCSFTSEKKKTSKCVRNSCVTAVERHRGWRMELLTGAGTGLVNLLFIPFLHLLFPSLSHFRCASHSKRGSLIRGVCVCVGTLCTCVYVGERQRERETLGNRCVFFFVFFKALTRAVVCVGISGDL